MKLGQLQEEISKASLLVSAGLCNNFKSIILETVLFMRLILEEQQKYLQPFINNATYHIMMLHIRQSIYLVLTNVSSASFLNVRITFDEISTALSVKF